MDLKSVLKAVAKYYVTAAMVTAFIAFEAEGIEYSNLFVAVLTTCLGTTGIMIYGEVKK